MSGTLTRRQLLTKGGQGLLALPLAGGLMALAGEGTAAAMRSKTVLRTASLPSGTINVWFGSDKQPDDKFFQQNVIKAFQQVYPDVDVKVTYKLGGEELNRLESTALQAGQGPDIVTTGGPSEAGLMVRAGLLKDLTAYSHQYHWDKKLLPWALSVGRAKGKLLLLPNEFESPIILYNKTLFAKNGWTPPKNRDELEAIAKDALDQKIMPFAGGIGGGCAPLCFNILVGNFFNHGAGSKAVYDALSGKLKFSDAVFVDALTLLQKYMQAGWFGGGFSKYIVNTFDTAHQDLAAGRGAMTMEGSWFFPSMATFFKTDSDWDWASNPALSSHVPYPLFQIGVGSTFSIGASSKNPDAAAAFLDWYYSNPARVGKRIAAIPGRMNLPIHFSQKNFPATLDSRVSRWFGQVSKATADGAYGYPAYTFWPPKTHVWLYSNAEAVMLNKMTPKDYCAGLAKAFKSELSSGGYVPPLLPRPSYSA